MIELILVGLFQAAAGDPLVTEPTVAPQEQTVAPAAEAATEEAPAATQSEPQAATDRVICRTVRTTGSRVRGERVCMTERQMQQQRRDFESGTRHGGGQPREVNGVGG